MIQTGYEGITLRPMRTGDEDAICRHANNIKIWNNMRDFFPNPYTKHNAEEWIAYQLSQDIPVNLAICFSDEVIGMVGITRRKDIDRLGAELGFWLGEEFWGKGIMTAALKVYAAYIFSTFEIIRIEAGVFEENIASQKVLQKAGFTLESIRKYVYIKNGKYLHGHFYVLLKPELENEKYD